MTLWELQSLSYLDACIRLGLAVLFGLLIGLDRDLKGKPVDFRAFIIVCTSTCLLAILGTELPHIFQMKVDEFVSLGLGKIISGALTGIGFLGAGAIIKDKENDVVGTATGASIWASAIIGLCLGFGFIILATIGFLIIYGTLLLLGYMRNKIDT